MPYQWHVDNNIAHYESYYCAVFYSHFVGIGLEVVAKESASHGRSDWVVRHPNGVWVFKFKSKGNVSDALR